MTSQAITRRAILATVVGGLAAGHGVAAAEIDPIEIAVLPFFSTRLMIETYEPLRASIEQQLGRPAYLVTASDFHSFTARTEAGQYGLILTAPHLGRLAELEAGYRPLLQWAVPLSGVFMVDRNSPIRTLAELRGQSVATPDPLAVITMLGEEALAAAGLTPGADLRLEPLPSHNAALLSVLRGETAAALTWANTLDTVDPSIRDRLRPLAHTAEMKVASVFMAGPRLSRADAESFRAALLAFAAGSDGRSFLARTGYQGIIPVAPGALAAFDRFLPMVRRLLAKPSGGGR